MEPSQEIKSLAEKYVTLARGIDGASLVVLRTAMKFMAENNLKELNKVKAVLEVLLTYPGADTETLRAAISDIETKLNSAAAAAGGKRHRTRHRKMSRKYCKKTPCRKMGFSQKASCRPYKNCYLLRQTRRAVAGRRHTALGVGSGAGAGA